MRFAGVSLGHRLPFGLYGRAYFAAGERPRYNPRAIDSTTLIAAGSAYSYRRLQRDAFVIGFFSVFAILILRACAHS
jgi:hypothetical protein